MANWRDDEKKEAKSDPGKLKSPKPISSDVHLTGKTPGGWRSKDSSTRTRSSAGAATSSAWKGDAALTAETVSGTALRKWLTILALSIVVVVLTCWTIYYAWMRDPKLILVVSVPEQYDEPELIENPYGSDSRGRLSQVNSENVASSLSKQGDGGLEAFRGVEWIKEFQFKPSDVLKGGGPSRSFVAFYINAFARFEDSELVVFPPPDAPFETPSNAGQGKGIKLELLLSNVADSISEPVFAWVILDLQLPPILSNLSDLDAPWRTATQQAIEKIGEKGQRLLVTVPCDDGQQNWLSPEFSSSFFGHYIRELMEGRFAKANAFTGALSLGQFQAELDERVKTTVMNRRYALQIPQWLTAADVSLDAIRRLALVTVPRIPPQTDGDLALRPALTIESPDTSAQWQKLTSQEYYDAYRWDPYGYAKVESALLALEDAVVYRRAAVPILKKMASEALDDLKKPTVEFRVSLIEDEQRAEFFHKTNRALGFDDLDALARRLAAQLEQSAPELPSFWSKADSNTAETQPPKEYAETSLTRDQRPFLVWKLYVEASRTQSAKLWQGCFQPDRLEKALEYADQMRPDVVEMLLLLRIARDIDWAAIGKDREIATASCAGALTTFQSLQELATCPEPELSWWLRKQLAASEQEFLLGLDWLLAGHWNQASDAFRRVDRAIANWGPRTAGLKDAIAVTRDGLHWTPHLLAWLLKDSQLPQESSNLQLLEELGECVERCHHLHDRLATLATKTEPEWDDLVRDGQELRQRLDYFQGEFLAHIARCNAAPLGPELFRRNRIALQMPAPWLEEPARDGLRTRSLAYLGEVVDESMQSMDAKLSDENFERPIRVAAQRFLSKVQQGLRRQQWSQFIQQDLRANWSLLAVGEDQPSSADDQELLGQLSQVDVWQRVYALPYGNFPSLHASLAKMDVAGMAWPWSAAWQRWNLAAAHQQELQVERLAAAAWGNGPIRDGHFLFADWASRYNISAEFTDMKPIGSVLHDYQQRMTAATRSQVERLNSLVVEVEPGMEATIKGSRDWNGIADVYLKGLDGNGAASRRWTRQEPSWTVDLMSTETPNRTRTLDTSGWASAPLIWLSIRGNTHSHRVPWEKPKEPIKLALTPEPYDGTRITFEPPSKKPTLTALLLIDCSESMEYTVNERSAVMDEVKQTAMTVLDGLKRHSEEANVECGLLLFGLTTPADDIQTSLEQLEFRVYRTREVGLLDSNWYEQLASIISGLKPQGDTPLYNAIVFACEMAQDRRSQQSHIFVLTDGVNSLSDDAKLPNRQSKSYVAVDDAIQRSGALVNVFHFDYFNEWSQQQGFSASGLEKAKRIYDNGKDELKNGIKNLRYFDNRVSLLREIENSIPKTDYRVRYSREPGDSAQEKDAEVVNRVAFIPREFLPAKVKVDVSGNASRNAPMSTELIANGGENIRLSIEDENLQFQQGFYERRSRFLGGQRADGDGLQSELFVEVEEARPDTLRPEATSAPNQFRFALNFIHKNRVLFTPRPRFFITEVSSDAEFESAYNFILADHYFVPELGYPRARLSDLPWSDSEEFAFLRIWAGDSLPPEKYLRKLTVQPETPLSVPIGIADIHAEISGTELFVTVKYRQTPDNEQRVVIICPEYRNSNRSYAFDQNLEEYRFLIPANSGNMEIQCTTVGQLQRAVEDKVLKRFHFDRIDTGQVFRR